MKACVPHAAKKATTPTLKISLRAVPVPELCSFAAAFSVQWIFFENFVV